MRVRNIRGTKVCHARGSPGGAHKEIEGQFGVFIVPMCEQHNNSENRDWLSVKKGTIAVPLDEGDTTGPPGPCYCYA